MKLLEFNYKNTALVSESEVKETAVLLEKYMVHLNEIAKDNDYESLEASINLAFFENQIAESEKLADAKKSEKLKYIVVVGIGGSNLGTMAMYEALFGKLHIALNGKNPKTLFLDTNNPKLFSDIKNILEDVKDSEEILINVISKSGGTTETISNFETLYAHLKNNISNIKNRVVITTDFESKLWYAAKNSGFEVLKIPKNVGGRYSVFSAVGLFPLALLGVDVKNMLKGVKDMRDLCLSGDIEKNPALVSAILMFLHNKNGVNISNSFFFNPQLEMTGKWYRQLMGESIGKEKNKKGDTVNSGITPITSVGSTDLHSMAQLFLGGPKDKFTTFINTSAKNSGVAVPEALVLGDLVDGISGKDYFEIMDAIYGGVKKAYENKKVPYMEVVLPEINENSVGQFMQFKMIEMMFLAELLGVNAFDQPNVEDYKKETRDLLEK